MSAEICLEDVARCVDEITANASAIIQQEESFASDISSTCSTTSPQSLSHVEVPISECSNKTISPSHSCVRVSPPGSKKKRAKCHVRFADDEGKDLYASRECPPSDVPPDLDVQAILKDSYVPPVAFGALGMYAQRSDSQEKPIGKWAYSETTQPMDDYIAFAKILEEQWVLAENVFTNNDKLICTIKVKCVKKVSRVFARLTFNNWISFDDVDCTIIPLVGLASTASPQVLYQRYCLERQLPPVPSESSNFLINSSIMFCFCVRFEDGEERWDNHFNKNYVIEVKPLGPEDLVEAPLGTSPSDTPAFVVAHHFANPQPGLGILTEEEQRHRSRLRMESPDYTYYNESSEFYW